jgi:orotidine-5'-phosphate decarboxylase
MKTDMYNDTLRKSAKLHKSLVCLGLDPLPEAFPFQELAPGKRIVKSFEKLFDRMIGSSTVPGAFKPNIGYYHRLDRPLEGSFAGSSALAEVLKMIREAFPEVPVILDAKRGDIATSSANYAEEAFESWKADAVTVAPYMGSDSTGPFTSWCAHGKGVYVLNRTSNPGGAEVQNLELAKSGKPLYLQVAMAISLIAAAAPGCGAVVGATNPSELEDLARFYASRMVPLLIPGVGGQGGSASVVVSTLNSSGYPLELARINSSSGITHPWAKKGGSAPAQWDQICLDSLRKLQEEIGYEG